jgi:hypothetical protein
MLFDVPSDLELGSLVELRGHRRSLAGTLRDKAWRQPADESWSTLRTAAWVARDSDRREA